ncbi:MAG: protein kinase [Myxococcota bacterium]|jgi:serine/threonine-protein kinase|nr:protein kinase [Myxococcota bacterium]
MDYSGKILDNKYQVITILGRGGMGAVYKGVHKAIGKSVAIKFLHAEFAGNSEVVKRFYREAQAAAAIGHGNIIDVMDVGVSPEGEPYLVMEYLEGESLSAMLRRVGPLPVEAACGILEPVLLALHAAHAKGIVHRDLKPENIFLVHREGEPPKVKLIDFGISKFVGAPGNEKLTQTGSVMGTPSYMSPEQARGDRNLDHRSDLYAAGVIFYEMLTACLPFPGENYTQIIINILTAPPLPPREAYSNFPGQAESSLMKSLEKNPDKRHQSALEFLNALKVVEGFSNRQERLTMMAAGITHKTFASGDLGKQSDLTGPSVAADVLSQVMGGTPTGWAGTMSGSLKAKPSKTPLAIGLAIGATASVAAAAIAIWAIFVAPEPPKASSMTSSVASLVGLEGSVQIAIEGAPKGSTFKFGDNVYTGNPFAVPKDTAIVALEVRAPGFAPHSTFIVPSENRVVRVDLRPLSMGLPPEQPNSVAHSEPTSSSRSKNRRDKKGTEATPPKSPSASAPTAVSPPATAPVALPSSPAPTAESEPKAEPKKAEKDKRMVDGARGTKIRTSFE